VTGDKLLKGGFLLATKKMILDLDTGIDDSMAIAYALAAPDVDIIESAVLYSLMINDASLKYKKFTAIFRYSYRIGGV